MAYFIDRTPKGSTRSRRIFGNLEGYYVPYLGASQDVNLGSNTLETTGDLKSASLYLTEEDNLVYVDAVSFMCSKEGDVSPVINHSMGLGFNAGTSVTTGNANTCVGSTAGSLIAGGDGNTCIGNQTGWQITAGDDNTVLGRGAGATLTTPSHNTFVGARAGQVMETGYYNVFVGSQCGLTTGNINSTIAIGYLCAPTAGGQCLIGSDNDGGQITQMYLGNGVVKAAPASPADFTMQVSGGSGSDQAAADFYIAGGKSTGNATPGRIIFQTTTAGASGSTVQTLTDRMTIGGPGGVAFDEITVGTINLATNVISDSTGTISFDNENLVTTGTLTVGADASGYELDVHNSMGNSTGNLNIQENVEGDIHVFSGADVANDASGGTLFIWRLAAEGDGYFSLGVNSTPTAAFLSDLNMAFQTITAGKYMFFESGGEIYFDLGDAAGTYKFRIRDSGSTDMMTVDSNGAVTAVGDVTAPQFLTTDGSLKMTSGARIYANADTNDNLVINAKGTGTTYINYDSGSGGVYLCDGATGVSVTISSAGNISADGFIVAGFAQPAFLAGSDFAGGVVNIGSNTLVTGTHQHFTAIRNQLVAADAVLRRVGYTLNLDSEASAGASNKMGAITLESTLTFANTPDMYLWTGGEKRAVITYAGDVGIGTATPDTKFQVVGTSKFGDDNTNYVEVSATGTQKFVGSAGLVFGSCYGNDIGWSQAAAAQNTWYNISDVDMADGVLHGVTHDGSGKLTVTEPGMYKIDYALSFENNTANDHIEVGIEITGSGSANAAGQNHTESKFASEEEGIGCTAILDLADNATIEIAIRTTDNNTPTIAVQHLNITVVQLGGT